MKDAQRVGIPKSLQRNANRWKWELLEAMKVETETGQKAPDKLFNRYKKKDVDEALDRMYNGFCCYCEQRIGTVAYKHIEHRKPKRPFPQYTFDWHNLHLSCPRCNGSKGNKWDDKNPILDAVTDTPIERHLTYKESKLGILRWGLSYRGTTTICHTDLDREDLRDVRTKIYLETMKAIREIREAQNVDPDSPEASSAIRELDMKCKGEFGSLIAWAMHAFL